MTPPSAHLLELENTVIHFPNICEPIEVQGWVLEIQWGKGCLGKVPCLYLTHSPEVETKGQQNLPSTFNLGTGIQAVKVETGTARADATGMLGPVWRGSTRFL